jgi:catechol 2,3-dioxygenase-like lactoylglutathione lyase family enzyme
LLNLCSSELGSSNLPRGAIFLISFFTFKALTKTINMDLDICYDEGPMSINYVSSVLFVKDMKTSRRFYEGVLGQEVELDHGECVVYKHGFSLWLKEYAHNIIFKCPDDHHAPEKYDAIELYFETDDIIAVHGRILKHGARSVHDIEEQPWGQRVFRAYDPDGYIVEFAEPMVTVIKRFLAQGMSVEEASKRTSMPLDIVCQVR